VATTITQLKDRAVAWSSANGLQSLVSDTAEIINRVAADERVLFDLAASLNSYYFATTAAVTSSSGTSARTITTSALTPPVGRILRLVLASGDEVNQVDVRDQDAELSPRYFLLGTVLTEVSNDWSASSGTVSGTLTYVKRPTALSTTGALTQTVTMPDEFADLLEMKLAYYLAHKDYGRETPELTRLEKLIEQRTGEYVAFLQSFGGTEARRFTIPSSGSKR
jgi:hypothetical protein